MPQPHTAMEPNSSSHSPLSLLSKVISFIKSKLLIILILISSIAAIGVGLCLLQFQPPGKEWTEREKLYIKFPGEIIINCFQALIVPLITSAIVTAVGSVDISTSGKIGARAFVYYFITSVIAVTVGISCVSLIRPGERGSSGTIQREPVEKSDVVTEDVIMDMFRNIVLDNVVQATMYRHKTVVIPTNASVPRKNWNMELQKDSGVNAMGLIFFSGLLGLALAKLGPKGKPILDVFTCLYVAVRTITNWLLWLTPVVIFSMLVVQILEGRSLANIWNILRMLSWYFLTILLGLAIHSIIVLPIIYTIITRTLPFKFISNMSQALLTAFGTSSSAATIPVTIECLEKNKVHPVVTRFVLLGATINMDGTALYEAIAPIFIAQLLGIPYTFGNLIAVAVTATFVSMGTQGFVALMIVLNCVGLPVKYIYYILPIDFILGRFRTAVNVLGDAIGAGVLNHICRDELANIKNDGCNAASLPTFQ